MKQLIIVLSVLVIFTTMFISAFAVSELEVYTPLNNEVSADNNFRIRWAQSPEAAYSLIAIREVDTDMKILNNYRVYDYSYTIDASMLKYGFKYKVWIANYSASDEVLAQTIVYFSTRSNNVGYGYDVNGWYYLIQGSPSVRTRMIGYTDWFSAGMTIRYGSSYSATDTINAQVSGSLSTGLSESEKASLAAYVGASHSVQIGYTQENSYYVDPSRGSSARVIETLDFVTYNFIREKKNAFGSKTESVTMEFPIPETHKFKLEYD